MINTKSKTLIEKVVIKFSGDSGDGMQLTGSQFSDESAWLGNDIATFPDYPSEIRAPAGTVAGVSGFQLHFGSSGIHSPGDKADVLIAMNPAALKANLKNIRSQGIIIIDIDSFDEKSILKAEFQTNPLTDGSLSDFEILKVPISSLTRKSILDLKIPIDNKSIARCKNMFALGFINFMFSRNNGQAENFINKKFRKDKNLIQANLTALATGYNYAENIEAIGSVYAVKPKQNKPGIYRNITGNKAVAWGLMAASEKSGLDLFLGSYPITPATDIMQELAQHKWFGVKVFQAEDEIAGICSSIGASFAGNLAVTTTSGPGLALKSEAIGLAIMAELPLVVVDVQRGGPSTGLPTKTEQSDLNIALYGRHGESPAVVLAAGTPSDCFDYAYMACKIAIEHMTPVILLTDGYLGNGAEAWRIKSTEYLPEINVNRPDPDKSLWKPYIRNHNTLARFWAIPGMKNFEHRIGGLEKQKDSGNVSYEAENHAEMVRIRHEKIKRIANVIPVQKFKGKDKDDLLIVGWGGTFGTLFGAVNELQEEGYNVGFTHFNYICPLPSNTNEIFSKFKRIVICELNLGQFANYLRTQLPQYNYLQINKVKGQPFTIDELKENIKAIINN